MKEILLSQQGKYKGMYVALVDDEDFEYLNQWRWSVYKAKNTFYAIRNVKIGDKKHSCSMQWDIMGHQLIDHVDGNGLNYQRKNLRYCTTQQNCMNKGMRKNTSSMYKGVCRHRNRNKYISNITFNDNLIHLGYFVDEIEAAKTYDKKAVELFGEFARLNFPL